MSALGHKRTFSPRNTMSALPPKADIGTQSRDVRFVPIGDIAAASAAVLAGVKKTRPTRKQARRFSSGRLETDGGARRYWIRLVAELNHRVRGFDAGRQERRQEHERAFGRLAVRHHRSDGQRPQRRDLIGARPSHRWIVDLVARRCELLHHLESDRSTGNALANLVFEIVGRRLGALVLRQEMSAGVWKQLIAPNRHGALFVDKFEAVHAEVGGRRVAHWRRIPRGQERLRGWVRLLEGLDWRRRRDPWLAAGNRQEELLKLLGVLRRKAVVRMGDEIGVTAVRKTKPDG